MHVMFVILHIFGTILSVSCTNRILYGPDYPNRFACLHDVYGVASNNFKIPSPLSEKLVNAPLDVSRVVESYQDTGIERELTQSAYKLYEEARDLKNGLVYTSTLYYLQLHIAKDYVASQVALASLNSLKTLVYATNTLTAFAKVSAKQKNEMTKDELKFGICTSVVYLKVAEKLEQQRNKQLAKIMEETKRIANNITSLPAVKSTGDLYLLKAGWSTLKINAIIVIIAATLFSYFM